MMFLLRTAFWMSVALALLPSVVPQASSVPVDIGAAEAMAAASAAFSDLSGLCGRRPDACAAGAQVATVLWQRTRAGATILYDLVGDRYAKAERAAAKSTGPAANAGADGPNIEAVRSSQHTLTTNDMVPPWHSPSSRKEVSTKRPT